MEWSEEQEDGIWTYREDSHWSSNLLGIYSPEKVAFERKQKTLGYNERFLKLLCQSNPFSLNWGLTGHQSCGKGGLQSTYPIYNLQLWIVPRKYCILNTIPNPLCCLQYFVCCGLDYLRIFFWVTLCLTCKMRDGYYWLAAELEKEKEKGKKYKLLQKPEMPKVSLKSESLRAFVPSLWNMTYTMSQVEGETQVFRLCGTSTWNCLQKRGVHETSSSSFWCTVNYQWIFFVFFFFLNFCQCKLTFKSFLFPFWAVNVPP